MSQSADVIKALVSEGAALKERIKTLDARAARKAFVIAEAKKPLLDRLQQINALLLEQGKGDYLGEQGEKVSVIEPAASLKPTNEEIEAARVICGKLFPKLIEETIIFTPNKSFRSVAAALLKPEECSKLITMFEKPSTPYVKWA